jgi:hypothetical protein
MKKYLLVLLAGACLTGCKKEKDKTLKELTAQTAWVGELQYTNQLYAEPFSLEFDGSGGFDWYQNQNIGASQGQYTLDEANRKVTLTFNTGAINNGVIISFVIEENNRFGKITVPPGHYFTILNGSLASGLDRSLDNSTWTGTIDMVSGKTPYELKFKPGNQMSFAMGTNPHTTDIQYLKMKSCLYYYLGTAGFAVFKGDTILGEHYDGINFRPYRIYKK